MCYTLILPKFFFWGVGGYDGYNHSLINDLEDSYECYSFKLSYDNLHGPFYYKAILSSVRVQYGMLVLWLYARFLGIW